MQNTTTDRGGAVSFIRVLIGIGAVFVLSLTIAVGPASGKTVYDYVYSGTYFDGTDTAHPFDSGIATLAYDAHRERLFVGDGGFVSRFTKTGTASPFSALGSASAVLGAGTQIAVDQSGGPTDGTIYGSGPPLLPDGTPLSAEFTVEFGKVCGIAVDPVGHVLVPHEIGFTRFTPDGAVIRQGEFMSLYHQPYRPPLEINPPAGVEPGIFFEMACRPVIDSQSNIYSTVWELFGHVYNLPGSFTNYGLGPVFKWNANDAEDYLVTPNESTAIAIDPSNDDVFVVEGSGFSQYDRNGAVLGKEWGKPEGGYLGITSTTGITVDPQSHDVWVANKREYPGSLRRVEKFEAVNPTNIPDTRVVAPSMNDPKGTSVVLKGIINPGGTTPTDETTDCHFEFGLHQEYKTKVPCEEGQKFLGTGNVEVSAKVSVTKAKRYFYKLSSKNGNGRISLSGPTNFIAQGPPKVLGSNVDSVITDGVRVNTNIDPNGGNTTYKVEFGPPGEFNQSTSESDDFGFHLDTYDGGVHPLSRFVTGLLPGHTYQYRVVATNEAGSTLGPTEEFRTYVADPGSDPCPNSHVRQQTEASLLPDCRAYELVSAANSGGYDVISDIIPGKTPLTAYPRAKDRLLYSVDFGLFPDVGGSPTNLGVDPYVATRGEHSWSTKYVGLPSDAMADPNAFGSPLFGADPSLQEFAFAGQKICNPCFEDGSTNIPLRLANGELIKGMAGTLDPAAAGNPSQKVVKPFSADGTHFVFGSNAKFEDLGDTAGSIYERDLEGGGTQVVSTLPGGTAITGGNVAELDLSKDGSRVLIGKQVGALDSAGNVFYHLYMHIGASPNSVDLTAGTTTGVLFDGMSEDGTRVFFTTKDHMSPPGTDTDESADIYETDVDSGGTPHVRLISTNAGVVSNYDGCEPPGVPDSWNAVSGNGKCNAVAFAGGAGIASENGTFYFVSPEQLDGSKGEEDQVNLYVVEPGANPKFVTTMDSSLSKAPPPPPNHPVKDAPFISGLSTPQSLAVDQSNGDIYAFEANGTTLSRFTPGGLPDNFAKPGGSNKITGLENYLESGAFQVAVDNAPGSPFNGDFYVTNELEVAVFAPSGEKLGGLSGGFFIPCGVAVDQSNGAVYVGDALNEKVWRFAPTSNAGPVTSANYSATSIVTTGLSACQVAADKEGRVYASGYNTGPLREFSAEEFAVLPPNLPGSSVDSKAYALGTDSLNNDLYVTEGNQISQFDSSGNLVHVFGGGVIGTQSRGVAIDKNGYVYGSNGAGSITRYGVEPAPYSPIDSGAVLHGVRQAGVHSYGDFQVSPDGRFALFSSPVALTGYPISGNEEIYRYDAIGAGDGLDCVSCPPSGVAPKADAHLASGGLNLSDDGRAFFTTFDELALRDSNKRLDVYEWSNGSVALISDGIDAADSGLVTVSADGTDAFFYTRASLAPTDTNGRVVKISDARAGGGYPLDPPREQCRASDECHGSGTPQPPPPDINTQTGTDEQEGTPKKLKCRKGFVKRHGKCVRKSKKHHHRNTSHRHG